MERSIIGKLEEHRCEALADFFLAHIPPKKNKHRQIKIELSTMSDLRRYLLLDGQIGQEPETSEVAEKIAAAQKYIGGIYLGMEPGYPGEFSKEELQVWYQCYSNISDWAGYEMLKYWPENWITPDLRANKTDSFREVETELGQASLTEAAVQTALHNHLKGFEEICNLELISGYINSAAGTADEKGENFKNADYYFIGRQRVQPYGFFWRKAYVNLKDDAEFLSPTAWSEWTPINIPAAVVVLAIRPVFFAGRLMVVHVEGVQNPDREDLDNEGVKIVVKGTWKVEMKVSYLAINGIWSTPMTLQTKTFTDASVETARLVAVVYNGPRKDVDDHLAVCFTTTDPATPLSEVDNKVETENGWIFAQRNALFEEIELDVGSLKVLINNVFRDQNALQYRLSNKEAVILTQELMPASTSPDDTREGELRKYLSINLNLSDRQVSVNDTFVTEHVLQVQGVTEFNQRDFDLREIIVVSTAVDTGQTTYFELSRVGVHGVKITCYRYDEGIDFSLCFDDDNGDPVEIAVIKKSEFSMESGIFSVAKNVVLTRQQREQLFYLEPGDIEYGGRFSVRYAKKYTALRGDINKLSMSARTMKVGLGLKVLKGTTEVPVKWEEIVDLKGWFQTKWFEYAWREEAAGEKVSVIWGETENGKFGRNRYDIKVNQMPKNPPVPLLRKQSDGAQFLDITPLQLNKLQSIRLNSLFGPQLVAKAALSIDELLSLNTQYTEEPGFGDTPNLPIDFNGAHGMFYWELFFHLPFMIAHRLCQERKYLESQRWYHYIFNPHIRNPSVGEQSANKHYWPCRPLLEEGDVGFEALSLVDPDAIAFSNRVHYRKAIFMAYVRCIIAHADALYRRLTRDSLTAAELQYTRAESLLGSPPDAKTISHWVPRSVHDILQTPKQASALEMFAQSLDVNVANLPARVQGVPDFETLKLDVFRLPTNENFLDIGRYVEECLSNIRHNRTIDGQPMSLPLFAPPTDPKLLLLSQAGGAASVARTAGGWTNIPHYRFRTMLATAQNAVQILIGFGREVRELMEMRARGEQDELQQRHVIVLGEHTRIIQEETIKQLEVSKKALMNSRSVIEERVNYHEGLIESGLVKQEIAANELMLDGKKVTQSAKGLHTAGGIADAASRVQFQAGMVGVSKSVQTGFIAGAIAGGFYAAAAAADIASEALYTAGDFALRAASYKRREGEWRYSKKQASGELSVIDEQLKAHDHTLNAARASLAQMLKANAQAEELYTFYKTRATNVELYRWLLSQISTLYFQMYDVVVGLCLGAQASWQYEMGDFDLTVIRTSVWLDSYHGQGAGKSMLFDLARLEREFLSRNERRLELTKTVSLRQLYEQGLMGVSWDDVLVNLVNTGKLDFEFSQRMFDSDYPGHYCRQIKTISISLPAVLGPYEDVHATLTQIGSITVLKPNVASLSYLYEDTEELPPLDIILNLRSHQQIGISRGLDDCGLYQLMFDDERYLPFEGTGGVSSWQLYIPLHKSDKQRKFIERLSDVVVHVRYMAKVGGTSYTQAVLERLGN